jgi:hypothetical protein
LEIQQEYEAGVKHGDQMLLGAGIFSEGGHDGARSRRLVPVTRNAREM